MGFLNKLFNRTTDHTSSRELDKAAYESKTYPWAIPLDETARSSLWQDSIRQGNDIDDHYVRKSREASLPFLAESEQEYEMLTDASKRILEGNTDEIVSAILLYRIGAGLNRSEGKADYLSSWLTKEAASGNRCAQAALFNEKVTKEWASYRKEYEQKLIEDAEAGDKSAQFAMGLHVAPYGSLEKVEWLLKAAEQGCTDACYALPRAIDGVCYSHGLPSPSYDETFLYRKMGAEADNGIFASNCQYDLGEAYLNDEGGVGRNLDKARYWLEKAARNGSKMARASLDLINDPEMAQRMAKESTPPSNVNVMTLEKLKLLLENTKNGRD